MKSKEWLTAEELNQIVSQNDVERYIVFIINDKKGLRHPNGFILVPPIFDDIAETYEIDDNAWKDFWCVPVVSGSKYALYKFTTKKSDGILLTDFKYDKMYRYYGCYVADYVVELDGKKGVLDSCGEVIVPIEQDEIYEQQDFDGCIPFVRCGLWGLCFGNTATNAIFEDILIQSEDYAKVKLPNDSNWYYLDNQGHVTLDRAKAFYGSWYDFTK